MSTNLINGIVIDNTDYEDYAKVVTIYSNLYGKLSFYAPGVNKSNSKNKNSIQLYCLSEFEIFKSRTKNTLSKLKTGTLLESFYKISKNYLNYIYSSIILKVLLQIDEISFKHNQIFEISLFALRNISKENNSFLNYLVFLFEVLKLTDYSLKLKKCARCRKSISIVRFDYVENELICKSCIKKDEQIQPYSFLELLRIFDTKEKDVIVKIKFNTNDLLILHSILVDFFEDIIGFDLGPIKLLKSNPSFTYDKQVADQYK
ncbi:DNA repair protein recO [Spiroplasma litorale]|uniref:DNA repair protein RecO n=1 Tax=Spiroplasma litorale TaxID=216942 RepID=A0A0K1W1A1_9MOLU|nr:DNA repair protein RecO [Spiroplasma litorale]AKX33948.1 DNA repair protein recO [Spiroplasma litorale]